MEMHETLALFGEAEKGNFNTAYFCESLPQLMEVFGHPPPESQGLDCAIQALLYQRKLIFFRVEEEGFSYQDYFLGLRVLQRKNLLEDVAAICLPGVGNAKIIDTVIPICELHKSVIITTESDLYDYLTSGGSSSIN